MYRFLKPLRSWSHGQAGQRRPHLLIVGLVVLSSLLAGIQFLPLSLLTQSALAAPTSAKPPMQKATFTLDGVTVTVNTPFLPGLFTPSKPGDPTQTAVAAAPDFNAHPYGAIYITAVPYGTKPQTEGVPIAQAGSAQTYRASLHQYRVKDHDNPQIGPTLTLFGQQVRGEASLMLGNVNQAFSSTLVVEWVVEAGKRIWIVRITQEEAAGTVNLKPTASFLASLRFLTITSSTLTHPTTVKAPLAKAPVTNTVLANYPSPSWWNGTCNDKYDPSPPGSYSMANWHGLDACGPVNQLYCTHFGGLSSGCAEQWQCVEFVQRYLIVAGYIQHTYVANGNQIVSAYPNSNMDKISNGTPGKAPQPGDVLSYDNTGNPNGHTSLVTAVSANLNSTGNGTITVIQQNSYDSKGVYPTATLNVSNWNVTVGWATITGWLHDNSSGGGGGTTANKQSLFAVGSDHHLYTYYWSVGGYWSIADLTGLLSAPTVTGTSSSYSFQTGGTVYQNLYINGTNGHLYQYWATSAWHLNDLSSLASPSPPSGVSFNGSPTGYTYTLPGQSTTRHAVFDIGSDGHLYLFDWNGTAWSLTDLSVQLGASVSFVGIPSGYALQTSPTALFQWVYVNGSNGHLYELWWGGSWNLVDLGAGTPLPSGVSAVNSPSAYSYTLSGQTALQHSIQVEGSDGHLYLYHYDSNNPGWTLQDLTTVTGGLPANVTVTGRPSGYSFMRGTDCTPCQDGWVTGSNGHIYEYIASSTGTWSYYDLNNYVTLPAGVTVTGSPWGYSYLLPNLTEQRSIYIVGSDGHLYELLDVAGSPWALNDHGLPASGVTLSGSSPNGFAYSG